MHSPNIAAALVTEPGLRALVLAVGIAMGAALAVFVIDTAIQIHRRRKS